MAVAPFTDWQSSDWKVPGSIPHPVIEQDTEPQVASDAVASV